MKIKRVVNFSPTVLSLLLTAVPTSYVFASEAGGQINHHGRGTESATNFPTSACEATSGWTMLTNELEIGGTRKRGNVRVYVYDSGDLPVLKFSVHSEYFGVAPVFGEKDVYSIESIF